jgi:hypothetical protein
MESYEIVSLISSAFGIIGAGIMIYNHIRNPILKNGLGILILAIALTDLFFTAWWAIYYIFLYLEVRTPIPAIMVQISLLSSCNMALGLGVFAFSLVRLKSRIVDWHWWFCMAFAFVAAIAVTVALRIFRPARFTDMLIMGVITITTMVVTIVALVMTAYTLIKERQKERQKFDETAAFKVYEERKFKAKVLMLRLVTALTFANLLFWVPYGIFQMFLLLTFEKFNSPVLYEMPAIIEWIYHFYVAIAPSRGLIHYIAILIALKFHSFKVEPTSKDIEKEAARPRVEQADAGSDTVINEVNPSLQFNPAKGASDKLVSEEQEDNYRPSVSLGIGSGLDANGMSFSTAEKVASIQIGDTIPREPAPVAFDSLQRNGSISMPRPVNSPSHDRPVTYDSLDFKFT